MIRQHDHDGLHKKTKLKCKQNFLKYLRELETFQTDCHRTDTIAACTVTGQLFIAYKTVYFTVTASEYNQRSTGRNACWFLKLSMRQK